MGEGKDYQVIIARSATIRYHQRVLPYLYENFSFERAAEIDEKIVGFAATLKKNPGRGRTEEYLENLEEGFRFLLFKETRHFELKIIYYIDEPKGTVYVTDFFPTKMNPQRITDDH